MCGRYSLSSESYNSFIEFMDMGYPFSVPSRFNVAPTQPVAVLRLKGSDIDQSINIDAPLPAKEGALMRWGLIPHFAKEIQTDRPLINARSETIDQKPSFQGPFKRRKCLIVADGYYEWKRGGASPVPYHICLPDKKPFVFAGIWQAWTGPAGEDWLETVAIITKASSGALKKIHHRAPIIICPEDYDNWLRPSDPPDMNIFKTLSNKLEKKLEIYQVNPYVNNVRHDGELCIKPATTDQFKLF